MAVTYRDAGVDIDAGDELVERIKPLARSTRIAEVVDGVGGFAGLCALPSDVEDPLLVSGTDGVGTKLKVAFATGKHDSIGIDLVAMCANDVLTTGARPLFFLDYFACGKLDVDVAARVVGGIARGCEQAGCALIGGETAEMPDMYPAGEYDLAGFAVGAVEKSAIIDGSRVAAGDVVLGLASSGAHSNGYSLVRRVIERAWGAIDAPQMNDDFHGRRFADAVLAPTRIYVRPVLELLRKVPVKGIAHITGGGLVENVPRVLPDALQAVLRRDAWSMPPIFEWLQRHGGIDDAEMHRVFNCGIGLVLIVGAADAATAESMLVAAGETVHRIGEIVARPAGAAATIVV